MLLLLATEFDSGELSESNEISEIIKAITNAKDFDEEAHRDYLERIEGKEKGKKLKLELEKKSKREWGKLKLSLRKNENQKN